MTSNVLDPNSIKAIIKANVPHSVDELFPFIGVVKSLSRDDIKSDVVAGLTVAAHTIRKTLKAIKLGMVDTLAGAVLGFTRAVFGLSVLLRVTGVSPLPGGEPLLISSETREASILYGPVEAAAPVVWDAARAVFPTMQARLGDLFNSFDEGEG